MNESMGSRIKGKIAQVVSDGLVHQGEQGVKMCGFLFLSESEVPLELMREDAE